MAIIAKVANIITSNDLENRIRAIDDNKTLVFIEVRYDKNEPHLSFHQQPWPLRGFLKCPRCGRSLTGSTSKGNGGIYYYYHCIKGCKERHKANEVNNVFCDQLTVASKNEKAIRSFELIFKNSSERNGKDKANMMNKYQQELDTNKKRLQNAQTLLLDGRLNPGDYQEIRSSLQPEIEKLTKEITMLNFKDPEENNIKDFGFFYLRNLEKCSKQLHWKKNTELLV